MIFPYVSPYVLLKSQLCQSPPLKDINCGQSLFHVGSPAGATTTSMAGAVVGPIGAIEEPDSNFGLKLGQNAAGGCYAVR